MRINHNMTAVRTNLNLNRTTTKLDSVTYKLSSGYKINGAKDDPAGYAILRRLNTQIRGLNQADSNAGDGISAINTAEGALTEIQSMLQRINELSVQSANDTNTPDDRDKIQDEIDQLKDEIDRVAETTDYNGRTLLNGDSERTAYVATTTGASAGEFAKHSSILSMSTTVYPGTYELNVTSDPQKATVTFNITAGEMNINGELITITQDEINDLSAFEKIQTVCDRCNIEMVQNGGTNITMTTMEYGEKAHIDVKNAGATYSSKGVDVKATINKTPEGFSDNAVMSVDGNIIIITDTNGYELRIKTETGAAAEGAINAEVKDAATVQMQIGSEADNMMELVFEKVSTETLGIYYTNVRTYEGSQNAITDVQNAIDKISQIRSKLGAYENRIGYAQDNLSVQVYNVTDATARIGDTDMSEAMTSYTELNVLEQASSNILSKANQRAETILQLLQS